MPTTGRRARAGTSTFSHSPEDHVGTAQAVWLVDRLLGGVLADCGIGLSRPHRAHLADRDLDQRVGDRKRLEVRIHGDEVDLGDPGVHHAMDRVQAGADAHDADRGDVRSPLGRRHAMEARRRLEHRLEIASGSP